MQSIKNWFKVSLWLYLLPLAVSLYYYPQLPNKIAIHFNLSDQPNHFTNKFLALFISIALIFLIELFSLYVISKDPKKNNQSKKLVIFLLLFMPIMALTLNIIMISYALNTSLNVFMLLRILISFLIIIMGNYLPKTKRNHTLGIRLPWTLSNDDNWIKTHAFAGKVWFMGGVLLLLVSIFSLANNLFIGMMLLVILSPLVYSYAIYQKQK
ncbi:SdpI family protein [Streptococcus pacificus]|uniref:SdpI family protein n=1 Tax=Streptococcus pacificus TaxID=2740577 RepID=A0ABS0ZHA3_9STRE|nr:SdpI family protein [Streptococcus pacificus]MBJ8325373.1 SdpI family protein [Streptococcus pacificus]